MNMKKFMLTFFMSFFLYFVACAQDSVVSILEVKYLVTYVADTVRNIKLTDTYCLRFNDEKSLFYKSDTFIKDSLRFNDIAKWNDMMSKILNTSNPKDKGGAAYYVLTDYIHGTYIYQEGISGSKYRYSDSLPFFDWQILPEYKIINKIKCQKAIGKYMGRTYEAWFSTVLSVKASPWKFYGLPGLVMEVYDTRHLYAFKVVEIQPCSGKIALFPSRHFKTTKEKFLKELYLYLEDPIYYQENNALYKVHFGKSSHGFITETRNNCRYQPMELLK